jgi:hypothetical protein
MLLSRRVDLLKSSIKPGKVTEINPDNEVRLEIDFRSRQKTTREENKSL